MSDGTSQNEGGVGASPTSTFLREWVRSPLKTAAILPSSRWLARAMAFCVRPGESVVEIGAGTGAITDALIERIGDDGSLLSLDINPTLAKSLKLRHPNLDVHVGDARNLIWILRGRGQVGRIHSVVSSLGLLAMPDSAVEDVLRASFGVVTPGGKFIQFTYGPSAPVSAEMLDNLGLRCDRVSWVMRNIPPASVYVIRRKPGTPNNRSIA